MFDKKIKLVHCIASFESGGTELNLMRTLERLDPTRFDISILVLKDRGELRERFLRLGFPIVEFRFPTLLSFSALRNATAALRWLREQRPDIVHSHDRYTNTFVTPCARLAGVPFVITSRRWWTAMPRPIYRIGNQFAYRIADCVIANSQATARLMAQDEGIGASKIEILPNFLSEEAFQDLDDAARAQARRRFGIPDGALAISAVTMFRPEKDLETLIRALALLKGDAKRAHLLLIGSGPTEADLRRVAAECGVADRIHFAGYHTSPPNPHVYGDISVLCSLHEGFPNSVIEAMAAARPVVATEVGGIPDAVDAEVTGLLVPPHSPEFLASALCRLIRDPQLSVEMGKRGRVKARALFGADKVLHKLNEIYVAAFLRSSSQARSTILTAPSRKPQI